MSSALAITDLQAVDGTEPRLRDLRLAEALGFEKAHNIRKLIERHQAALVRLGEVFSMVEKTSRGGRPAAAYWLNKKQALYLCTKSEAPLATEVTLQMVEVFDAWLERQRQPEEPEASLLPPPAELRLWLKLIGEYRQALGPTAAAWLIRILRLPYPPAETLSLDGLLPLADSAEGEACLRHLAAQQLGGVTVGEAISRIAAAPVAEVFLARRLAAFGVAVSPACARGHLAVSNGGEGLGLEAAFAGSPWAGRRWRFALRTLPSSRAAPSTIPFADARNGLRATLIPLTIALPLVVPASAPTGGTEHG